MNIKHSIILSAMAAAIIAASPAFTDAQAPRESAIVQVKDTQLIVQKRLGDGSLDKPRPYTIKGLTWSPATRAPSDGPNPLDASKPVPYGFFFDWPGDRKSTRLNSSHTR